jgi:CHAD domain-containing protein
MAKARPVPGLSADDPYAAAAAKILEVRVSEVIDLAGGVLDVGDIERVHDMRVATRRLRAVLEIFEPCFPRDELNAGLQQVKGLADALGERRDRDVAIAALEKVAASMTAPDRPGIETLIARLRAEQATANESLERFVTAEHLTTICEQLTDLVASARPADGPEAVSVEPLGTQDGQGGSPDNGVNRTMGERA